jgi:hypothetical protein
MPVSEQQCTLLFFRQKFTLEDAIGSHACSLEANMRVTNGIPLRCSLVLPVDTANCVQTLKAHRVVGERTVVPAQHPPTWSKLKCCYSRCSSAANHPTRDVDRNRKLFPSTKLGSAARSAGLRLSRGQGVVRQSRSSGQGVVRT